MFNYLLINSILVEVLVKILSSAKFMNELVSKKSKMECETIKLSHHSSAIVTNHLATKKDDLCAFTILCTIGAYKFGKALCDLGASINLNLMPLAIFERLELDTLSPTTMRLLMADRSIRRQVGILYDVLV